MTKGVSTESLHQVIEEEKEKVDRKSSSKLEAFDSQKEAIPYPDTKLLGLASQNSFHSSSSYKQNMTALPKKPSTENLHDPWTQGGGNPRPPQQYLYNQ